jgi:hypothetical protein
MGRHFRINGLIWMLLERLAGLHGEHIAHHATYTNLFAIVATAIYVFALRDKRETDYNGVMSYKQGLVSGIIITVIVTVLTPLSQYITATFVTPDYFDNIIAYTTQQGLMEESEAREYFSLSNYMVQSLIAAPVLGIVTTAIVAFFVKKEEK